jgi:hypothetical protein
MWRILADRKQNQTSTQNPDHFSVQNDTMKPNSEKIRLEWGIVECEQGEPTVQNRGTTDPGNWAGIATAPCQPVRGKLGRQ